MRYPLQAIKLFLRSPASATFAVLASQLPLLLVAALLLSFAVSSSLPIVSSAQATDKFVTTTPSVPSAPGERFLSQTGSVSSASNDVDFLRLEPDEETTAATSTKARVLTTTAFRSVASQVPLRGPKVAAHANRQSHHAKQQHSSSRLQHHPGKGHHHPTKAQHHTMQEETVQPARFHGIAIPRIHWHGFGKRDAQEALRSRSWERPSVAVQRLSSKSSWKKTAMKVLAGLLLFITVPLSITSLSHFCSHTLDHRKVSLYSLLSESLINAPIVVASILAYAVTVLLGLALAIVPGLWCLISYSQCAFVAAVEPEQGVFNSLRASRALTRNYWDEATILIMLNTLLWLPAAHLAYYLLAAFDWSFTLLFSIFLATHSLFALSVAMYALWYLNCRRRIVPKSSLADPGRVCNKTAVALHSDSAAESYVPRRHYSAAVAIEEQLNMFEPKPGSILPFDDSDETEAIVQQERAMKRTGQATPPSPSSPVHVRDAKKGVLRPECTSERSDFIRTCALNAIAADERAQSKSVAYNRVHEETMLTQGFNSLKSFVSSAIQNGKLQQVLFMSLLHTYLDLLEAGLNEEAQHFLKLNRVELFLNDPLLSTFCEKLSLCRTAGQMWESPWLRDLRKLNNEQKAAMSSINLSRSDYDRLMYFLDSTKNDFMRHLNEYVILNVVD